MGMKRFFWTTLRRCRGREAFDQGYKLSAFPNRGNILTVDVEGEADEGEAFTMLLVVALISIPAFAQTGVAGKWVGELSAADGHGVSQPITLELKLDGQTLSGTVTEGALEARPILSAAVRRRHGDVSDDAQSRRLRHQCELEGRIEGRRSVDDSRNRSGAGRSRWRSRRRWSWWCSSGSWRSRRRWSRGWRCRSCSWRTARRCGLLRLLLQFLPFQQRPRLPDAPDANAALPQLPAVEAARGGRGGARSRGGAAPAAAAQRQRPVQR